MIQLNTHRLDVSYNDGSALGNKRKLTKRHLREAHFMEAERSRIEHRT